MASLNVCLQVSFLGEGILAERANEWPLPGVLLHVDLKSVLLVERLPTDKAGKWPFPSVMTSYVGLHTQFTFVDFVTK